MNKADRERIDYRCKCANGVHLTLLNKICNGWIAEHRFHPTRRWRFDFALPEYKIAIEIEGGIFSHGRHTRGVGYIKDLEKYNEAVMLDWRILRYTPTQLGEMVRDVERMVKELG